MLRADRDQYKMLAELIENNEVFDKAHFWKQLQLSITLFRLGDGETISIITKKKTLECSYASNLSIGIHMFARWDWIELKIVSDTFDDLPFCIEYIDGLN